MEQYKKAYQIYRSWVDLGIDEDRMEYTVEDIMLGEGIDEATAKIVKDITMCGWQLPPLEVVKEYFEESNHNGWDGWEPEQVAVIAQLYNDLNLYARSR